MTELFLKYTDEKGEQKRVAVSGEKFVVGRHSESDLHIPDGRLSRQHLKIERFADVFVASDAGSSNGTLLNDTPLKDPIGVKDGDVLDLGGFKVVAEFETDGPSAEPSASEPEEDQDDLDMGAADASLGPGLSVAPQPQAANASNSWILILMIPILALIVVVLAGGVIYLLIGGSNKTVAKKQDDFVYSTDDDDGDNKKTSNTSDKVNTTSQTDPSANSNTSDTPSGTNGAVPPGKLTDTGKIEQNGGAFLRRIAQNDPHAFLTGEQAQRITPKVKQLSGSSALADNLNSARKNASQIKSLAQSKNIKPQFLAIAAVAKLGSSRGDVLQTAQGMADVLDKLSVQLGNEFGEDALLIIAAYGQGSSGDFMRMRNMLQDLANKFPESSRAIRTIWFLQKNGKITQAEFENALNFLAIGAISQNPKDFGVNAEALAL